MSVKLNKRKLNAMYYLAKVNPNKYRLGMKFGRVWLEMLKEVSYESGSYYTWQEIENVLWSRL